MGGAGAITGPDLTLGVELGALSDDQPFLGHAHGEAVVLVKRGAECFALGATCSHYSGPLAEGLVVGDTIRCPWHHARFALANGAPVGGPGLGALPCFEVAREGGLVRVGKKREPARAPVAATPARPASVAIVGSGAAGMLVADTLRAAGYDGAVTLIGAEGIPVDRPNLSKDYLAGTAPEEWLPLRDEAALAAARIALVAAPARALDLAARVVHVEGQPDVPFEALVLATGCEPQRLSIPGAALPHVHVLRTLADSRRIIAAASAGKRVVVIGGGFIGLEVAAALRTRALDVTVVMRDAVPLARQLGAVLGGFVAALHREHGVTFVQDSPAAVSASEVALASGKVLAADVVVMGVGVRPRVELAAAAGLRVDDGIVVDDRLRASAPGVYAVGDVARFPWGRGPAGPALVRVEHWVHAERMGYVAAHNILGRDEPFRMAPFFWSQHYDVPIAYVGAGAWDAVEVVGDPAARDVIALFRAGGAPVAFASIYRDGESLAFEALLERGATDEIEAWFGKLRR